jgi:hypothetical protein
MSLFGIAILLSDKFSSDSLSGCGAEKERKMRYYSFRITSATVRFQDSACYELKGEEYRVPGFSVK